MANAHLAAGGDWRDYWRASAFAIAAIVATVVVLVQRRFAEGPGVARMGASDPQSNGSAWTARTAMKTPAFITISAALTVAYFCGVTVSTWSVAHLQNAGLAPTFAVAMFSLYSGLNAGARAVGGVIVRRVAAKRLLVAALLANVIGMSALAFAHTPGVAIIFAVFDGFAFGMALFATTAIIIDYFGLKNSPSLLGAANLAATVAMLGPMIAGETADRWGGFAPIFMIYAAAALAAALAVGAMRDPNEASAS
jgi:MFS family permease